MYRIEIIANRSVEENLLEVLKDEGAGKFYTKFPNVLGVGSSGPRMGDAIWPEENIALVFWCEEDEARAIARAAAHVKEQFPGEGVKIFGLPEQLSPGQSWGRAAPQGYAAPQGAAAVPQAASEPVHIGDVGDNI